MEDRLVWGVEPFEETWHQTLCIGEFEIDAIRAAQEFIRKQNLRAELVCHSKALDQDTYYVGVRQPEGGSPYFHAFYDQLRVYLLMVGSIPLITALKFEENLDLQVPLPRDLRDAALIALTEVLRTEAMREQVDEISSWLLMERNPVAHPDPRWDSMLYPTFDCEQYLKSIMPPMLFLD